MNRDTICVQGGYTPGNGEPRQIPIIQSTTFKYATSEDMGKLFDLEADGYFYPACRTPPATLWPSQDLRAGGRHRRYADLQRSGSQLLCPVQYLRGRRPHRGFQHHLRRHLQPDLCHHGKMGISHLCGPLMHRGGAERRLPAQHQGGVRRDHCQPRPDRAGY